MNAVWFGTVPRAIRVEYRPLLIYSPEPRAEMRPRSRQIRPETDAENLEHYLIDFCRPLWRLHVCHSAVQNSEHQINLIAPITSTQHCGWVLINPTRYEGGLRFDYRSGGRIFWQFSKFSLQAKAGIVPWFPLTSFIIHQPQSSFDSKLCNRCSGERGACLCRLSKETYLKNLL
jgi:hypothetical protein